MDVYETCLGLAVLEKPDDYGFGPESVTAVRKRMEHAIRSNVWNHDGLGFKKTCKHFGIKYLRRSMERFFSGTLEEMDLRKPGVFPEGYRAKKSTTLPIS
jgi:hypothetical protein